MSESYRNKYEIRIFGMRRSGNHMLANWIASLFDEPVYYFNNCPFKDPFQTYFVRNINPNIRKLYHDIPILKCKPVKKGEKPKCQSVIENEAFKKEKLKEVRNVKKECLLLSFEDFHFNPARRRALLPNREETIGRSEFVFDVLVLRDFFNWSASRLCCENTPRKRAFRRLNKFEMNKWNLMAREFFNETHYLEENKIPISYNKFIEDKEYREQIARRFKKENRDWTLKELGTMFSRGSSFDKNEKMHNADEMKTLERWKFLKDDEFYRKLVNSETEAVELSERIFGHIPGTECLLD